MSNYSDQDIFFIQKAYQQALLAYQAGEVPIGAVLVRDDQIIVQNFNQTIGLNDPTAHAEILVLRSAALKLGNYRLVNTKLYVTLEPCIMCLGGLIQARVPELVYACDDSRVGAFSREKLHHNKNINHNLGVTAGVMADECGKLLKDFFKQRRN
ncbi:nucleoside deaminase [Francisella tularensis]|uniref:tRNA adenosine(34) deaminase TadA n=1 Tax=Francisella tularensis TaxID=263 RepID=UPI00135FAC54|nr:tRNA adenosine(34) deaminase TadA [Francisella tularensis]MWY91766.1 nucleoside deaminase [Francisella tularensis]